MGAFPPRVYFAVLMIGDKAAASLLERMQGHIMRYFIAENLTRWARRLRATVAASRR